MSLSRLLFLVCALAIVACKSPNGNAQHEKGKYSNHLANESSPYLLQHANNPVDWYPWGEAALTKAKNENKLLLISVGYAACHWCHVMEHESFEDTLVSKIMNENFVNIKVDREERPDVDDVYMTACHLASGKSCGWPLNAFALADGRPIFAGTYYPKKDWISVLKQVLKIQKESPEKLLEYAEQLTAGIQQNEQLAAPTGANDFTKNKLAGVVDNYLKNIDYKKGGRKGGTNKFPMPNNYQFLLAYYQKYQDKKAFDATKVTLDNMAWGGIYDQLGGGFARYSTDQEWLVPHFEKMLYDNAQLVSLYSEAYQMTKDPLYKKIVTETLEFIERELTDKSGGFYSSLDADSEGEEGKFYVWTKEEIETIINNEEQAKIFCEYFSIKSGGNWEHGKNILHRTKTDAAWAKKMKTSEVELFQSIQNAKEKLFKARAKRVRPGLDNKVLCAWNALMLKGYVDAYRAFGEKAYLEVALKNGNFILEQMLEADGRLNRNYKDGKSVINAFLDDYALTIDAFISLYQVTFDESWLYKAKDLGTYVNAHFFDEASGMYHYTSDIDPPLIARKKEIADNVIPGSNSAMGRALYYLGTYFYEPALIDRAKSMLSSLSETLYSHPQPSFYSNWCRLYMDGINPPYELAIVGKDYERLRNELMRNYLPNAILLGGKNEGSLELLKDKLQEGETMIYVCQNKVCKFPVMESEKALSLMD
ncbi:MAG: thioredoxin domain-containing protein [Saprospiraceae bacterium]